MSATVDSRIVEMRFDNSHFEKNAQQTIGSMNTLKQSLDVGNTAIAFNSLGDSFSTLTKKAIGLSFISSIVTDLSMSFKRLINEFSVLGTSKAGFAEYELKMGSIQTIMAGTGETLDVVNAKLDELNKYSDQTIYSFSDMTSNIGKFTNAGVKLDDAVSAIKGISNVAALSGANANEAARAMYNFSQSISSGSVKLIDWKSIENANMATAEFKKQLLDAAVAAGTVTEQADGMYKTLSGKLFGATKDFNNSLQEQWMTTDVLVKTLRDYADETTPIGEKAKKAATEIKTFTMLIDTLKEAAGSGWARTWEIFIGDFEQAKKMFTKLGDILSTVIGGIADSRNNLLEGWANLGGREDLLSGFKNISNALVAIVKPISEAFRQVFPKVTFDQLHSITIRFKEFTEKLIIGEGAAGKLYKIFKGVFTIFKILKSVIFKVIKGIISLVKSLKIFKNGLGKVFDYLAKFGEWLFQMNETGKVAKKFKKVGDTINKVFTKIASTTIKTIDAFKGFSEVGVNIIKGIYNGIKDKIKIVINVVKEIGLKILEVLKKVLGIHSPSQEMYNIAVQTVQGMINGFVAMFTPLVNTVKKMGLKVIEAFKWFADQLPKVMESPFGGIISAWNKLKELVGKVYTFLKPALDFIKQLFISVWEKIQPSFEEIKNAISEFIESGDLDKLLDRLQAIAGILMTMNLGALFNAIKNIIIKGTFKNINKAISGLADTFKAAARDLNADAVKKFATSILLLVAAIVLLSLVPEDKLWSSIGVLELLVGTLVGVIAAISAAGKWLGTSIVGGFAIIEFAVGLIAIVLALRIIEKLDPEKIKDTVDDLKWVFISIIATFAILSRSKGITGLTSFAAGLLILIFCLYLLHNMPNDVLLDGGLKVIALMILLSGVSLALGFAARISKGNKGVAGILALVIALVIVVYAIKELSKIDPEKFWPALLGVGIILSGLIGVVLALAFISKLMQGNKMISLIGIIIAIALALAVMTYAVSYLGAMEPDQLTQGLEAVGRIIFELMAIIAMIAIAAVLAQKSVPALLAITLAIVAIGAVLLALSYAENIDQGISALAAGLLMLIVTFGALAFLATTFAPGVVIMVGALLALSLVIVAVGVAGLLLAYAFTLVVDSILKLANINVGNLALVMLTIMTLFLSTSASLILVGIAFLAASAQIGIGSALIVASAALLIVAAAGIIIFVMALVALSAGIEKLAQAIAYFDQVVGSNLKKTISSIIDMFNGLLDKINKLFGIASPSKTFEEIGKYLIEGFFNGVKNTFNKVKDGIGNLFKGVVAGVNKILGIDSPSKVFSKIGEYVDKGFINGIKEYSGKVSAAAKDMSTDAISEAQNGIKNISILDGLIDGDPVIRPVLDLSSVSDGAKQLSDMFDQKQKIAMISDMNFGIDSSKAQQNPVIINMTVNGAPGQDINQLADLVSIKINNSIIRREKVWR